MLSFKVPKKEEEKFKKELEKQKNKIKKNNQILNQIFNIQSLLDINTRQEQIKKIGFFIVNIDNLKTNQIRKILNLFNKIKYKLNKLNQEELKNELRKFQNLIVYFSGKSSSIENFGKLTYQLLENVLDKTKENIFQKFNESYNIIEGIIAHHKYFGGSD
ncbi:MAG: type III-A CRISPR-associated protein Csm2 [Promethearchaeota archaeon]